ncbi:EF-hand domain-containing protein [Xylophilus sp. ASV27]|uniref:EF-hand domain-containing protein n=1 Tax=Xylophilus sp. ASV27 TaxID=2795129 RepID=UPI0018EE20BE|nr:EF-hand domain-containing protein [Xylophilus sp. ASV27]
MPLIPTSLRLHALLLTALAAAGPVAAQAPAILPQPDPAAQASKGEALAAQQFKWLDLDGDGYLSKPEVALFPRLRDAFDEADTNHDGKVSFEEIRAQAARQRAERASRRAAEPAPAK